jgi:tRNA nucleotidyltransferase (CCA-adding enzyme)
MDVLKEVLSKIKPSELEVKDINERITAFLKKINYGLKGAKAMLGGSGAKDTWLSRAHDADIFVEFSYNQFKNKSEQLSDILEKHIKDKFPNYVRLHGSRDYFQIKEPDFTFEIVPILKISKADEAMNITDVSMLHAEWVNKHRKLADEIRLLKQFCKAQGIYGAESYIKGFSGYMCEIIVIFYGGFVKTLKGAAKWTPKTVIDARHFYKSAKDALFHLNQSKTEGPLVLVDPVQKTRNAAAALSDENFEKFIKAAKAFLKKPSKQLFEVVEITEEDLKAKAGKDKSLILVQAESLQGKPDIAGSKLLKAFEFINQKIREKQFTLHDSGWKWDKEKNALMWFIVDKKLLDNWVLMEGPPKKSKIYVEYFKKKHPKNTFIKNGRIYAKEKRPFRDARKLIEHLIQNEYVKDKVQIISLR